MNINKDIKITALFASLVIISFIVMPKLFNDLKTESKTTNQQTEATLSKRAKSNLQKLKSGNTLFCMRYIVNQPVSLEYIEVNNNIGFKYLNESVYYSKIGFFRLSDCIPKEDINNAITSVYAPRLPTKKDINSTITLVYAPKFPKDKVFKIIGLGAYVVPTFDTIQFAGKIDAGKLGKCKISGSASGNINTESIEYMVEAVECGDRTIKVKATIGTEKQYRVEHNHEYSFVDAKLSEQKNPRHGTVMKALDGQVLYMICLNDECKKKMGILYESS